MIVEPNQTLGPGAIKHAPAASFARDLRAFLGSAFWLTSAIILASAVFDGVGLLLIIPLLAAATNDSQNRWLEAAMDVLGRIGVEGSGSRIVAVTLAFLAVMVLRGVFLRMRDIRLANHGFDFIDHLRAEVIEAMARAPWQRTPATRRTDVEHTVNVDIARMQTGTSSALRMLSGVSLALAQIAAALVISWKLTVLSIVALSALAALRVPAMLEARSLGLETTSYGRRSYEVLARFISGLKLFKAHGLELEFLKRYEQSLAALRRQRVAFARTQANNSFIIDLGAGLVVVAIVLLGVFLLHLPLTALGLIVVIFARLSRIAFQFAQNLQSFLYMLPAFEQLKALLGSLRMGRQQSLTPRSQPTFKKVGREPLSMTVTELSYSTDDGTLLLDGVSFTIGAGETVALVGRSGAGKTTLLDLVTGLLRPDSGTIEFGALRDVGCGPEQHRARIAYVPQDSVFFDGELRENLTALSGPRSDEAVVSAMKLVGADIVPAVAREGLSARLGELGQRLSGGERQRLGLARALLREPGLLVLDEALSALDRESELRIMQMLVERSDMTVLLVTHRLPPGLRLSQVLRLEAGKLKPAHEWPTATGQS